MSDDTQQSTTRSRQYATFYLDTMLFGIDVQRVQEIIRYQEMTPVPLAPEIVRGLINLRGQIITAIDLRRRLGLEPLDAQRLPMNVVVHTSDGIVSLLVDRIGDVLEVEATEFEDAPVTLDGSAVDMVSGVYKLKNELMLVLNAEKAVQAANAV